MKKFKSLKTIIMKTTKILSLFAMLLAMGITFTSCDKSETEDQVTISQAEEATFVDDIYEEVATDVDNVVMGEASVLLKDGGLTGMDCPVVTVEFPDSTQFPRVITIDFGDSCTFTRHDQVFTKSGKIIVEVTDHFMNQGASRTVTFVDFTINGNLIEGTRTMTNDGPNADGFYQFTIQLQNGKITTEEGVEIERQYTRTRTMIAGDDTPRYQWDDEFLIEGNGSGVNSDGYAYTQTIMEPLYRTRNCAWFRSGVTETVVNEDEIVIDYGEGECDNIATRAINGGEPEEFTMGYRYTRRTGIRGGGNL